MLTLSPGQIDAFVRQIDRRVADSVKAHLLAIMPGEAETFDRARLDALAAGCVRQARALGMQEVADIQRLGAFIAVFGAGFLDRPPFSRLAARLGDPALPWWHKLDLLEAVADGEDVR